MQRWLDRWFSRACAAGVLTLALTGAAIAQQAAPQPGSQSPAVPAAEPPTLIDQAKGVATKARDVTEQVAKTFVQTLQGQSLLVGMTQTQPELKLNYHSASDAAAGTVEIYSGDPSTGYLMSLESPSKDQLIKLDDAGVWVGTWGIRFATSYGTFALRQTLQKSAGGEGADGEVQGDFLGFAFPTAFSLVRNSDVLPLAFSWGGGLGKAFLRYEAPLRYSVEGTDYNIRVQSDGYYARNMIFVFMDVRVWNVLFRWQSISMSNGEAYARYQGRRVATFSDDFRLDITTLAYVYSF